MRETVWSWLAGQRRPGRLLACSILALAVAGCSRQPSPSGGAALPAVSARDREAGRCDCGPTTEPGHQYRTSAKHETHFDSYDGPEPTTVTAMLGWPPLQGIRRYGNDPRTGKIEHTIYDMKGLLYKVKIEANDCDFHLEIAELGARASAPRIIVELPEDPEFWSMRARLAAMLKRHGLAAPEPGDLLRLRRPIPVKVEGLGFWDGHHRLNRLDASGRIVRRGDHGTPQTSYTDWELHPIRSIQEINAPIPKEYQNLPGPASENSRASRRRYERESAPTAPTQAEPGATGEAAPPAGTGSGPVIGNRRTHVYHLPGQRSSLPAEKNRIYFNSAGEARAAGFRPARE